MLAYFARKNAKFISCGDKMVSMTDSNLAHPPLPAIDNTSRAQDIESRMRIELKDIGIPPRPRILKQIENEIAKDSPDFIFLEKLISSDVGLSAGLIKTANSPFFAFGKKVRTVQEALLVLGLKLVVQTIAGLALKEIFKHAPNLERFWDSSAMIANQAGWIAKYLKATLRLRPEDAYTFALFRDCGIPVLIAPFPEYRDVLAQANAEKELAFTEIEDRMMAINHALVGAELAEDWFLPVDISEAIRYHHDRAFLEGTLPMPEVPEQARTLIAIAQLAEYLVQQQTGFAQTNEWSKIGPACLAKLALTEDELAELIEVSRAELSSE